MKFTKEQEFEIGKKIAEVMGWTIDDNRTCRDRFGFLIASNGLIYYVCQRDRHIATMLRDKMILSGFLFSSSGWMRGKDRSIIFEMTAEKSDLSGDNKQVFTADKSVTQDTASDECTMITNLFMKAFDIKVGP